MNCEGRAFSQLRRHSRCTCTESQAINRQTGTAVKHIFVSKGPSVSLSVSFIFHLSPQKQGGLFVTFKNHIKYQQGLTVGPQYINDRTKKIFPRILLCKLYNIETYLIPYGTSCCSWLNIALHQLQMS